MPATPDTSPANVARLLRDGADAEDRVANNESPHFAKQYRATAEKTRALADALDQQAADAKAALPSTPMTVAEMKADKQRREADQQAAAPTWEERVERAVTGWNIRCAQPEFASLPDALAAALKAAFPEYAPND